MNTGSTLGTAILRGVYNFVLTAMVAGITAFLGFSSLIDDSAQAVGGISDRDIVVYSILTGLLAGAGALGFRAGVEGQYDARRSAALDVKPADVGYIPPNPTP